MTEPVKLKPIAPSFAPSQESSKPTKKRSVPWSFLLVVLVVICALFAFQFVPQKITVDPSTDSPSVVSEQPSTEQLDEEVLPFKNVELQRAQDQAKDILTQFAALQERVESEQLGLEEHQATYDGIIDDANTADSSFAQREYDTALMQYKDATRSLRNYVSDQEVAFSNAFTTGNDALSNRDFNEAQNYLGKAKKIKPFDLELIDALERLEKLPAVNTRLREARRAALQGDYDTAESELNTALGIDPLTQNLHDELTTLSTARESASYNEVISHANAALNANELENAKSGFEQALRMRPGEAAATTGLQQVNVKLASLNIANLKATAERFENSGQLRLALQSYQEALAVSPNLQFALAAQERIQTTLRLTQEIERVLADPAMLSSDQEFASAQELLVEAHQHDAMQATSAGKIQKLATLIETASKPLELVLVSDNELDIRLATVGNLGPFDRKTLSLRPGRYLITGSADGCRDVRKTIVVEEGMNPVAILCNERI